MDKLKIIKFITFLLGFCIVFLLCFALNQVILKRQLRHKFAINLEENTSEKISNIATDGQYLYVATDDKVHIINLKDKTLQGTVFLYKGEKNGQKK